MSNSIPSFPNRPLTGLRALPAAGLATIRVTTAVALLLLTGPFATTALAREQAPLERVEALGLDSTRVGRVTAYFSPADEEYARQLAALSESARVYFEGEFGASFPLRLAVLSRENWFDPYPGGDALPYGMPWGWVDDLLVTAPASLDQGVLILGTDNHTNRRRVQFVLLHEFGHLAIKQHLHPDDLRPYSPVRWFEEFLATYFAYAYVRTHDPEWAEASRKEWEEFVQNHTPATHSLDWRFMRGLPPGEFAQTYAWYQNFLNLRVADTYEKHGLEFLRNVGKRLPWERSGEWTNASVLLSLEDLAPGFKAWSDDLQNGGRSRDASVTEKPR